MPNTIKYSGSSQTNALNKGNWYIGTGDTGKGSSDSTGYWAGVDPPAGGYTIYQPNENIFGIRIAKNNNECIGILKEYGYTGDTIEGALLWSQSQDDILVVNSTIDPIVTDGLVLYLDSGYVSSYPRTGTTWSDLSGNGNNGTLVNTPIYSTSYNGIYQLDGTNDYFTVGGVTTGVTWSAFLWFYYDGQVIFENRGHRTFFATSAFRYQWDDNNIGSVTSEGRGPFLNFNLASGGYANIWYNSITAEILLNRWHCVGITSDGTILKNYFDGVQRSNNATYPNRQFSLDGNMRIALDGISGIGSFDWFYENGGDNYIGPFLHYNRALTASEVKQNYNATKSRFGL